MEIPVILVKIAKRAAEELQAAPLDSSFFSNADFTSEELENTEYMMEQLTNHLENVIPMDAEEIYDVIYHIYEEELVLEQLAINGKLI